MMTDKDNLYKNPRIKAEGSKHLYEIGTNKGTVEVEANNRTQAASKAKRAGYEVRDVNMVG